MFENIDDKAWLNHQHRQAFPLQSDLSVEEIADSTPRFVVDSSGMHQQIVSAEPLGHPHLSLHQNHYAASIFPGSSLGSVDFSFRDHMAASISSFVEEVWSPTSRPAGLSFKVTPPGSTIPRHPAITVRADGRVALGGGPTSLASPLVSLGVYRQGVLELPRVQKYDDLLVSEPFINGAIVYVKDMDRVLISQGGSWHQIVTKPASEILPRRQIGEPRKDGLPTIFGPRTSQR